MQPIAKRKRLSDNLQRKRIMTCNSALFVPAVIWRCVYDGRLHLEKLCAEMIWFANVLGCIQFVRLARGVDAYGLVIKSINGRFLQSEISSSSVEKVGRLAFTD